MWKKKKVEHNTIKYKETNQAQTKQWILTWNLLKWKAYKSNETIFPWTVFLFE